MDNADRILNAALAADSGHELDQLTESFIAIGDNHPNSQEAVRQSLARFGD